MNTFNKHRLQQVESLLKQFISNVETNPSILSRNRTHIERLKLSHKDIQACLAKDVSQDDLTLISKVEPILPMDAKIRDSMVVPDGLEFEEKHDELFHAIKDLRIIGQF